MDVKITQTEKCACGRAVPRIGGASCGLCFTEGALLFSDFMNGHMTLAGFMRRLNRRK